MGRKRKASSRKHAAIAPETPSFSGPLAVPIVAQPRIGLLRPPDEETIRLISRNLRLLFRHYGVRYGNWRELCFCLADEFVPGIKVIEQTSQPRRGPKSKRIWNMRQNEALVSEVASILKAKGPKTKIYDAVCEL